MRPTKIRSPRGAALTVLALAFSSSGVAAESARGDRPAHPPVPSIVVDLPSGVHARGSAGTTVGSITPGELAPSCTPSPSLVEPVLLTKMAGTVARITWPTGDTYYWGRDVVRGGLVALSASGGDFLVATGGCLVDDSSVFSFDDPAMPPVGDGYWYVVRTDQREGCPGWGAQSYDEGWPPETQTGDRNSEILNSTRDCTCYFWCCANYNNCEP